MVGDVDHVGWLRRYAAAMRAAARAAGDVRRQGEMRAVARRLVLAANELEAQQADLEELAWRREVMAVMERRGKGPVEELAFGDYARVEEVAARLGLAAESVRRLMRWGKVPGEKMGNVWLMRRADLEELARDSRSVSAQLRFDVVTRDGGRCRYCGREVGQDGHIDHVWPVSMGGVTVMENLVLACVECNRSKSDRIGIWPRPVEVGE